jgi:ABC-type multidrug transport system fused ATPase/permease subunit
LSNNLSLIQDTRTNLINALSSINAYYSQNLMGSSQTLEQQTNAVAIMDKEMEQAKKRLAYINEQKENKLRVVEINQYYSASYAEWTHLVKILIITIVAFAIVINITTYFPILPSEVYSLLMFIITIISLYYIFMTITSIYSRDKMVYDEYNWNFNINSAPKMATGTFTNSFKLPSMMSCVGENCCQDGTLWNKDIGKCIVPEVSATTGKCSPGGVGLAV